MTLNAPLWLPGLVLLALPASAIGEIPYPPGVNFRTPRREYVEAEAGGWKVLVESELTERDPEVYRSAISRLDANLRRVRRILPQATQAKLLSLPIFLMYGERSERGGRNNGAEYFQKHAPEHFAHIDLRMGSSIVIYSATNYVWLSDFWAMKVLIHEFAHAHQLENWTERHPDIVAAHLHAMTKELYRGVRSDQGHTLEQGYAATNQLEYFAELSCMFFVGCDYFPFSREDLRQYDPVGYRVVERIWRLDPLDPRGSYRTSRDLRSVVDLGQPYAQLVDIRAKPGLLDDETSDDRRKWTRDPLEPQRRTESPSTKREERREAGPLPREERLPRRDLVEHDP